ncbi:MAG: hypothetical protein QOJ07_2392 [Thermoleophilaceae bacterium]|nr:hypothetical protein [Thermoleophilaceae bacterium]
MSLETVIARISELNSALTPPGAVAATATPPAPAAATSGSSTDTSPFASMLQGAMAPSASGGVAAPVGTSAPAGGSVAEKILNAARGELGVTEQPPGSNNSPRIAEYSSATAGSPGPGPWCAYFVSWCARQAGAPIGDNGSGLGAVDAVRSWGQRTGRALPAGQAPQPGDLILFHEHIGIVESVGPNGQINTIEGNSSDRVTRRTHSPGDATGYVRVG